MRGACVRMDGAAHDALAAHDYPAPLARVLGELMAASALLAASLKFRGSLIVQLAGPGPVRLAVVECDHLLALRATAQWDREALATMAADATLVELAGDGDAARLAITLDPEEGPIYQGIVALEAGSVASLLEHYLASSEQLASRLALAVPDGARRAAPGAATPRRGRRSRRAVGGNAMRVVGALDPATLVADADPTDVLAGASSRGATCACSGRARRASRAAARPPASSRRCASPGATRSRPRSPTQGRSTSPASTAGGATPTRRPRHARSSSRPRPAPPREPARSTRRRAERVRLDRWLWAARFYKTRALACEAIDTGAVRVGGERVKPARALKSGDCVLVRKGPASRGMSSSRARRAARLGERRGAALRRGRGVDRRASRECRAPSRGIAAAVSRAARPSATAARSTTSSTSPSGL